MMVYVALSLIITLVILLYLYISSPLNFWKNVGIPSAKPVPLFGNILDFFLARKHISIIYDDVYKSFPDDPYVGILELRSPNLIIRDVSLAHRILAKDFDYFYDRGIHVDEELDPLSAHLVNLSGRRWKSTRSKLMPAFSSGKLKQMYPLIDDCVRELDNHLQNECGGQVDVRELMAKFSTDVIGRCAFGLDFNTMKDPQSEFRRIGKKIFVLSWSIVARICLRLINPKLLKWIRIKSTSEEVEQFFFNLLYDTIRCRKGNDDDRCDILRVMCRIREQDEKQGVSEDERLSDTLLAANMFVFFAGGFETTASTLSYCLYELALNPEILEKVRVEIRQHTDSNSSSFDYDSLNELNYLEWVLMETLRKYAPIPLASRICTQPYNIPNTSIVIEKNQRVTIPIYSYHYDPKYFPNPNQFSPERFKDYHKLAYLPFGDGPRICIGLRLAKLEMKSCLAKIIANYDFSVCDQTKIPIEFKARSIFLTPNHPIVLNIQKI